MEIGKEVDSTSAGFLRMVKSGNSNIHDESLLFLNMRSGGVWLRVSGGSRGVWL